MTVGQLVLLAAALVVELAAVAYLVWSGRRADRATAEQLSGIVERNRAARRVLVRPCSYGSDLIEYHVNPEFDEDDVLATLAEIKAL